MGASVGDDQIVYPSRIVFTNLLVKTSVLLLTTNSWKKQSFTWFACCASHKVCTKHTVLLTYKGCLNLPGLWPQFSQTFIQSGSLFLVYWIIVSWSSAIFISAVASFPFAEKLVGHSILRPGEISSVSALRLGVGSGTGEFSLLIFANYKLIMTTFVFVVLR